MSITTKLDGREHKMAISYEDMHLIPSLALLYALQQVDLEQPEIT